MSRKEVLEHIHTMDNMKGYRTRMVTCGNGARQYCLAHIMYEDMGMKSYGMALELRIKDAGAVWMNQTMKGSMTK
eukprot:10475412-Heterocapsa_arctica.AAC.1